jgi:two-component system chemotaxis response regulator CheB
VIADDPSTAVVWSMPGAVADRGVADAIVPLPDVARTITRLAATGRPPERLRA